MYIKIDLCGAYNLVCIREGDKWNAMFKTHHNHFEYVVIPFGFTNAPCHDNSSDCVLYLDRCAVKFWMALSVTVIITVAVSSTV
jgi:hypothetical protein